MKKLYKLPDDFMFFENNVDSDYDVLSEGANITIIAKNIKKAKFLMMENANKNGANSVINFKSQIKENECQISAKAVFIAKIANDGKDLIPRDLSNMKDIYFDDLSTDVDWKFISYALILIVFIILLVYKLFIRIIF